MSTASKLPLSKWLEPPEPASAPEIAAAGGFPAELWALLAARFPEATLSAEAFDSFVNPRLASLSHPFAFPNIRKAAERISRTIDSHGEIVIFGDFDADGVTSTAILTRTIRRAGGNARPFIPMRQEGYGLTDAAIRRCLDGGHPSLLITVDCGITSGQAVREIISRGIDVIVTDHHIPGGAALPDQAILCAPSLPGTPRSCAFLSGAGVAFELASGLVALRHPERDAAGIAARRDLFSLLDMLAIATVSDIVPLVGDNRAFVSLGLRQMNSRPSTGVRQLMLATMDGAMDGIATRDLAFILGPHVNSAGRMATADIALELLLSDDPDSARALAVKLKETNVIRKSECSRVDSEIADALAGGGVFDPESDGAVVVAGTGWPAGVIGLSAAHLTERFNRPAIVIALDANGMGRGSVRAPAGYNVHDSLAACSGLLVAFGGHESAAGLTVMADSIAEFRRQFSRACAAQAGALSVEPVLAIDAVLSIPTVSLAFADAIASMAPFGEGNPEPVFRFDGVSAKASPIGRPTPKGLRLLVSDGSGATAEAVWFGHPEFLGLFDGTRKWSLAATVFADSYSGTRSARLRVVDAMEWPRGGQRAT